MISQSCWKLTTLFLKNKVTHYIEIEVEYHCDGVETAQKAFSWWGLIGAPSNKMKSEKAYIHIPINIISS